MSHNNELELSALRVENAQLLARVAELEADREKQRQAASGEFWAADEVTELRARVAELEAERLELERESADLASTVRQLRVQLERAKFEISEIAKACGYDSDDDPQAPKTLVDYVAEANGMALNECEQITTADRDAAIRKLSRNSATLRAKWDSLEEHQRNLEVHIGQLREQLDRATEPRAVKARFLADDGQGEREEFDTQSDAHDWAAEQLSYYRKEAESQGEWIGEAEDVAVWGLVESVREVKQECGVDFVLEPCAPATEPRPMSEAPRDVDIYLVHRHTEATDYGASGEFTTTLGRWARTDQWWYGDGGYDLKPMGWYPVPIASDEQALELERATLPVAGDES